MSVPVRAYLLVDARSGTELAAENASLRLPPASLTKLMTAYVVFTDLQRGTIHLDTPVTVSSRAARLPGARMFLTAGETVSVEDLLKGMLVQSGNDAAYALVELTAGDLPTFVSRMNDEAVRLGLTDTHFANATGLQNSRHYSSARDLARLAIAVRRDFPEYRHFFALREFRWAGITQPNRNRLLGRMPEVDGLKTGHTEAAGFCLAASARHDTMELVAVVLGTETEDDRTRAGRELLKFGLRNFETRQLYQAGIPLVTLPVWGGATRAVSLAPSEDVWVTLPRGTFDDLHIQLQHPVSVDAPVAMQDVLGQLKLTLGERTIRDIPLTAQNEAPLGNIMQRSVDQLSRWLREGGQQNPATP